MKIKLKDGVDANDLLDIHDNLWFMLMQISKRCEVLGLPLTITSIKSDRDNVKAKSSTHNDFRGLDLRTRDWTMTQTLSLVEWANKEFKDIAAITHSGVKLACLYHDFHIHFQVKP